MTFFADILHILIHFSHSKLITATYDGESTVYCIGNDNSYMKKSAIRHNNLKALFFI